MITLEAQSIPELERVAAEFLQHQGYVVTQWKDWETPTEFYKRIGICHMTFDRRLNAAHRPPVEVKRGPTGRIIQICSNELFDKFAKTGKW